MTRAIILSAGQGRRLLPLTENKPKCLLVVAGRSILQWQLDALLATGIEEIRIITGFHSDHVEELVSNVYGHVPGIQIIFNPFFNVSDNLASCWLARTEMEGDFLLINGDTVFEPAVLERVMGSGSAPVTLAVDVKTSYDEDDMKVSLHGASVRGVSKILSVEQTHAESIGMLYFRETGASRFRESLELAMREPAGVRSWFLSVVDNLAKQDLVRACHISGERWAEIDFIADIDAAEKLLSG